MPNLIDQDPAKNAKFNGLSEEIGQVIRDDKFQATVDKFAQSKNETLFRVIKGFGFAIALASGLFGIFLRLILKPMIEWQRPFIK